MIERMMEFGGGPGFGIVEWFGRFVFMAVGALLWLMALAVVIGVVFLLVRYLLVATKASQRYLDLNPAPPPAAAAAEAAPAPAAPPAPVVVVEETVIAEEVVEVVEAPPAPPVAPGPKAASSHVSAGAAVPPAPKPRTPRAKKAPPTDA